MDPSPRMMPDSAIGAPTARRCPSVASRPDERGDVPKQPRRSQQPDVHVLFLVATPEIGTSEWVRLVKLARAVEEQRRHDEHGAVTNYPDANRSDVFVLCPYNALWSRPERSLAANHGGALMLRSPPCPTNAGG